MASGLVERKSDGVSAGPADFDEESGSHEKRGLVEAPPAAASSAAAPAEKREAPMAQALPAISFWIMMSMATILYNKYLYTGTFAYPLTLTSIHMSFATLATQLLRLIGKLPVPELGWSFYVRNVVPIGVLFALSLGFSNLAAVRLSVSFIQMIKALTPLLALAISVAMRLEKATPTLIAVVSVMCVGVTIASYGEIEFDALGLVFQLTSITAEAARLVATQSLLQAHLPKSNPLVSISLFAPCSLIFLLPVALYKEPAALAALGSGSGTGVVVLGNTLTAFTLNIAVVILVSQTSGLTLTLAGIIKDIMLIVASIWLFGNPITYTQVAGYTLALYGLNMYHHYRAAPKGGAPPAFGSLSLHAATDKAMMVMGAGMVALLFVARSG